MSKPLLSPSDEAIPASLQKRVARYLEHVAAPRLYRRRYALNVVILALATLLSLAAITLAFRAPLALIPLPFTLLVAGRAAMHLRDTRREEQQAFQALGVARNGVPVTGYLVHADEALFRPGTRMLSCLVLFSFQPEVGGDADYMRWLARQVYTLKGASSRDTITREVAALTADTTGVRYRRRKLPIGFTDGSTIYCADLYLCPSQLKEGCLKTGQIPCIAESGDTGGIEIIPSWLLPEKESQSLRLDAKRYV